MPDERIRIERVRISGFKSIREADLTLGPLNVLIGANGAGKSNLVSYFALLRASLAGRLYEYVDRLGGPNAFLFLGPEHTSEIQSILTLGTPNGRATFYQRLVFQAPDRLIYAHDHLTGLLEVNGAKKAWTADTGAVVGDEYHREVGSLVFTTLRDRLAVHHFQDTMLTSPIRSAGYIEDNRELSSDGGNLAAFLFRIRETDGGAYRRIVDTIRLIAPFFDDFSLSPRSLDASRILLNWKQVGTELLFGPHQLSDGTLRAMALVALLLQPEHELPRLIVIDEPENGLHPYAVSVIASLIAAASTHAQLIVATQSPGFLDEFEPKDVVCVDREAQESIFHRHEPRRLRAWLKTYSLSEIWRKNLIGAGPH